MDVTEEWRPDEIEQIDEKARSVLLPVVHTAVESLNNTLGMPADEPNRMLTGSALLVTLMDAMLEEWAEAGAIAAIEAESGRAASQARVRAMSHQEHCNAWIGFIGTWLRVTPPPPTDPRWFERADARARAHDYLAPVFGELERTALALSGPHGSQRQSVARLLLVSVINFFETHLFDDVQSDWADTAEARA